LVSLSLFFLLFLLCLSFFGYSFCVYFYYAVLGLVLCGLFKIVTVGYSLFTSFGFHRFYSCYPYYTVLGHWSSVGGDVLCGLLFNVLYSRSLPHFFIITIFLSSFVFFNNNFFVSLCVINLIRPSSLCFRFLWFWSEV